MATVTMQLLLVLVMLVSSNIVESEPIVAPSHSQLPNEKFDLQTIQECTSSFLDVKECLTELFNFFHGGPGGGLPGGGGAGGGPPEEGGGGPPEGGGGGPPAEGGGPPDDGGGGGGGGPPDDGGGGGGGGPPDDGGGGGGVLQGMGAELPGIGGGLPGIGGGNIISPVCCKAITGIKQNCWPMMFPNPLVAPMIDSICGPS